MPSTGRALPRKVNLLGVLVSATDYAETTACVVDAAKERRALSVIACAVLAGRFRLMAGRFAS